MLMVPPVIIYPFEAFAHILMVPIQAVPSMPLAALAVFSAGLSRLSTEG